METIHEIKSEIKFGQRRAKFFESSDIPYSLPIFESEQIELFEKMDLIYRTLCGIMYNFVPTSGHPGGSLSSGRIIESIIYKTSDYDFAQPMRDDNDILVYAAGHKAMGLYAMYALRDELIRAFKPELLPDIKYRLRLEDLLGFRRNPTNNLPLFLKHKAKALDGHPTPATPFVKVATGASGVGVPAAFGLALAALDHFGVNAPKVNIIEGEGGMTPGRVSEALAAASSMKLHNVILHIDFNQASIDSNRVCRDGNLPGDYVQWTPSELAYLHDFNVIEVDDGTDFRKIHSAQLLASTIRNNMPTAIVYKTTKGWKYGIEGKSSHGAGHKFCSPEYYKYLAEFEYEFGVDFPRYEEKSDVELRNEFGLMVPDFKGDLKQVQIEKAFFDSLMIFRKVIEENSDLDCFSQLVEESQARLNESDRHARNNCPLLKSLYIDKSILEVNPVEELGIAPGKTTTIRAALGSSLAFLNRKTKGGIFAGSADLLGSTSLNLVGENYPSGFYDAIDNPFSRVLSIGGICEDAMGAMMAGLCAFGKNIGVSSSYGAFISAMEHTAARLHGIGEQGRIENFGGECRTWIMVNAHTGLKTGEDGPTHADPQCLQLLQGNFPRGVMITLTPWEPGEVWNLLIEGLIKRPAILAPFVTRPNELVADRKQLKLADSVESITGLYKLKSADPDKKVDVTIVLQESGVTIEFVYNVLPKLEQKGINVELYYVSSAELFDLLPEIKQKEIFPNEVSQRAMGITGFTLPTMYRWISSEYGRNKILHPFMKGHYLGSGSAESVLKEAGLDGDSMFEKVMEFIEGK